MGDLDGRLLLLEGVFNNYAIVPADKFMPIDVHVPGCPPRPEALMHGILQLREMVQDDPTAGWRERYGATGTEEILPGATSAMTRSTSLVEASHLPDATGLELIARRAARSGSGSGRAGPTTAAAEPSWRSRPKRSCR